MVIIFVLKKIRHVSKDLNFHINDNLALKKEQKISPQQKKNINYNSIYEQHYKIKPRILLLVRRCRQNPISSTFNKMSAVPTIVPVIINTPGT